MITSLTPWSAQPTRWSDSYPQYMWGQIDRITELIVEKKNTPQYLEARFDSVVMLINQGLPLTDLETARKLTELVYELHPLPIWWGRGIEWLDVLERITKRAAQNGDPWHEAWGYLAQASIHLLTTGADKVLELCSKARTIAKKHQYPFLSIKADLLCFDAGVFLEKSGDPLAFIKEIEKQIQNSRVSLGDQKADLLKYELWLTQVDVLRRKGFHDRALKLIDKLLLSSNKSPEFKEKCSAEIYSNRGAVYWSMGEYAESIESLEKAVALYKQAGNHLSQIDCNGGLGLVYWSSGNYIQAEAILQSSIRLAENVRTLWWQSIQVGDLGLVNFLRGKLSKADSLLKRHLELSELTNHVSEKYRAIGNIGILNVYLGQFENACKNLLVDLEYSREKEHHIGESVICSNMAWALDGLGEAEKSLEYANLALSIARKYKSVKAEIIALRSLAEIERNVQQKTLYAQKALRLSKKNGRRLNEAGALLTLAFISKDSSLYQQAETILSGMGASDWLYVEAAFDNIRLPLLL